MRLFPMRCGTLTPLQRALRAARANTQRAGTEGESAAPACVRASGVLGNLRVPHQEGVFSTESAGE